MKSFLIFVAGIIVTAFLVGLAGIYGYDETWHQITIGSVLGITIGYICGSKSEE